MICNVCSLFDAMNAVHPATLQPPMKPFHDEVFTPGVLSTPPQSARGGQLGASPREVLREALASGRSGEVVVRRGDDVGRVYLIDGHVGWAVASGSTARVEEIVRYAGVTLGDDTVRELIDECRRTGAHFADVLVSWGLLGAGDARECVRRFVADQLTTLLASEGAVALFLPKARAYGGGLRFAWSEVGGATIPPRPLVDAGGPAPSLAWIGAATVLAAEVERIDGVVGVVALDAQSGAIIVGAGEPIDVPIAGAILASLRALGAEGGEVIAVRGEAAFMGRTFPTGGAIIAQFDLAVTSLGMARLSLRSVAGASAREGAEAQAGG
jgi:hypothetical protein